MRVRKYKSTLVFLYHVANLRIIIHLAKFFNLNIYVYMYLITFLLTYISIYIYKLVNM